MIMIINNDTDNDYANNADGNDGVVELLWSCMLRERMAVHACDVRMVARVVRGFGF